MNGTTQAGPDLERAIRDYVRAYVRRHGRRKTAGDLGVSRHTLWRFLERGHVGRAVPSAVLNAVGGNTAALEAAALKIIIDLEGLRPDPALRPLREGLEDALLLLCAAPLATVDELSRFGRVPASTLRERLEKLAKRGLADAVVSYKLKLSQSYKLELSHLNSKGHHCRRLGGGAWRNTKRWKSERDLRTQGTGLFGPCDRREVGIGP